MSFANYPAPILPLTGAEQLMVAQSQNNQIMTCTATVNDIIGTSGLVFSSPPPIGSSTPNSGSFTTVSGNASAMSVLATGTTAARSLSARSSDTVNVSDYGAILNGSTNDLAAFQSAYNITPSGGEITIPGGGLWLGSGLVSSPSKSILWKVGKTLDYGVSAPGTNTVGSLGDGDVLETFLYGRKRLSKTVTNNTTTNVGALEVSTIYNAFPAGGDNASAMQVNAVNNNTTATGFGVNGILSSVIVNGSTGSGGNLSFFGTATISASASASAAPFYGQTFDNNGTIGSVGTMELDLFTFNSDIISNANPNSSLRGLVLFKANVLSGKSSGQVGRGISVATDGVAQIGVAYTGTGTLYYAAFDASSFNVTGSNFAGLRLAPGMGIDFSTINGTSSSLLLRQMVWNPTSQNLEYRKSGSAIFSITDTGTVMAQTVNSLGGNLILGVPNAQNFIQIINPSSSTSDYMTLSYNLGFNAVKLSSTTSNLELSSASSIFIDVPLAGAGWTGSMAAPPPIGTTTASSGSFTTLKTSGVFTLGSSLVETATQAFGTGGINQITAGTTKAIVFTASAITLVMPPAPSLSAGAFSTLEVFFSTSNASVTWSLGTGTQSFGGAALPTSVATGAIVKLIWDQSAALWIHVITA